MPKLTPEVEKQIREAAEKAKQRPWRSPADRVVSFRVEDADYFTIAANHILDALDDLAKVRRKLDQCGEIRDQLHWDLEDANRARSLLMRERDAAMKVIWELKQECWHGGAPLKESLLDALADFERDYPHLFFGKGGSAYDADERLR